MRFLALVLALLGTLTVQTAQASDDAARVRDVIDGHILPGYAALEQAATHMLEAAQSDCPGTPEALRAGYHALFDAWLGVSHLRFGPAEAGERTFAIAFWPDTKGFTPKALSRLIAVQDPVVEDAARFAQTSIAGRGIYALEFLLFDDRISRQGTPAYRCALIRAIATDTQTNARAILADWQRGYRTAMLNPGQGDSPYRDHREAVQQLFKALVTGLEFTSQSRLGRPMGSFERPRPKRAEAWRSGRSLGNVALSLAALSDLGARLSLDHAGANSTLEGAFHRALSRAGGLNDPVFAGVATPAGRLRVEVLQQAVNDIHEAATRQLGPALGVAAGFNSLDGD